MWSSAKERSGICARSYFCILHFALCILHFPPRLGHALPRMVELRDAFLRETFGKVPLPQMVSNLLPSPVGEGGPIACRLVDEALHSADGCCLACGKYLLLQGRASHVRRENFWGNKKTDDHIFRFAPWRVCFANVSVAPTGGGVRP